MREESRNTLVQIVIKVLHVISGIDPHFGGPGLTLVGLAAAQAAVGLDVAVAATYHDAPPQMAELENMRRAGEEVVLLGPAGGKLHGHPDLIPTLERAIDCADIVHIHALWDQMQHQAARLAKQRAVPYLFKPCGMLDPWSLAQSRWKKRLYLSLRLRRYLDGAAALHFTTQTEARLASRLGLKARPLIEPNGIDLAEFERLPAPGSFRARLNGLGQRPLILFLSRIHPKKGLDLLIPALARVKAFDGLLVIAGPDEGGYRRVVEQMIRKHALNEKVHLLDMLHGRDRIAALADADLFVLPSYQENFGVAVVESLAAGTPVLISDQVNIHEEITRAGVGLVVRTDVNEIAAGVSSCLRDGQLKRFDRARCRQFALTSYNWLDIARRWGGHYSKIQDRPTKASNGLATAL
jgi:glycosyltransferase involved in cell wall biosynthesis